MKSLLQDNPEMMQLDLANIHIDPVARLESVRALKLSRLENFRALNLKTLMEDFLTLKISRSESFRAI